MRRKTTEKFCGRVVDENQLSEICEIVATFPKLSRAELANTICELLSWKRPTGKLKTVECMQFLADLDARGVIQLPAIRSANIKGAMKKIQKTELTDAQPVISVKLSALSPIILEHVKTKEERQLWYEYVDRYHYLGYQQPFGAQLRYFIKTEWMNGIILGCLQYSSPAWRMTPRDEWITWDDDQRERNLQKIINNSRFLILPWVKVKNLASAVLALTAKTVPGDWQRIYGYHPVLLETLVDPNRFKGTSYKAANWTHLGSTTGRGRMDRQNRRHGLAIKEIYVYPVSNRFRQELLSI